LQISKWYSEAVNLRANNTMDKRKKKDRNTTQKAQDRTTRTPLIIGSELGGPGMHETLTKAWFIVYIFCVLLLNLGVFHSLVAIYLNYNGH
jgi:hypothetical protein